MGLHREATWGNASRQHKPAPGPPKPNPFTPLSVVISTHSGPRSSAMNKRALRFVFGINRHRVGDFHASGRPGTRCRRVRRYRTFWLGRTMRMPVILSLLFLRLEGQRRRNRQMVERLLVEAFMDVAARGNETWKRGTGGGSCWSPQVMAKTSPKTGPIGIERWNTSSQ